MELKLATTDQGGVELDVLIVPSGIETQSRQNEPIGVAVLIVPSGIETRIIGIRISSGGNVLIVPSGIETKFQP